MLWNAAQRRGRRALLLLMVALSCIVWSGCTPDGLLSSDDERDRDFQRARDAERLGDYEGAAEYYERALDRNPRSPLVHLSYASLCESQLRRYAYAVYHYQRYLRLRPDDPRADDIRRRVTNCTERLATSVPLVIRSETIARDLEAVRGENRALRAQVANLLTQVAYWSNEVRRVSLAAVGGDLARANDDAAANDSRIARSRTPPPAAPPAARSRYDASPESERRLSPSASATSPSSRLHRIQRGETLHRISRAYGVSVEAIRRANPGINERRLLPGTYLRIPPP